MIAGHTDDGRYVRLNLSGSGTMNVLCNTPYSLAMQYLTILPPQGIGQIMARRKAPGANVIATNSTSGTSEAMTAVSNADRTEYDIVVRLNSLVNRSDAADSIAWQSRCHFGSGSPLQSCPLTSDDASGALPYKARAVIDVLARDFETSAIVLRTRDFDEMARMGLPAPPSSSARASLLSTGSISGPVDAQPRQRRLSILLSGRL